jgi:hypothetical protein
MKTKSFFYCVYKNPPLVPILSQMNPVHSLPSYIRFMQLSSHLGLGLPSGLLPSRFPNNSCMHLTPVHATCPANPILFVPAILMIAVHEMWWHIE